MFSSHVEVNENSHLSPYRCNVIYIGTRNYFKIKLDPETFMAIWKSSKYYAR